MKKIIYIFICLVLFSLNLFSQETLTLQQAIETGLKNNYSILIQNNEAAVSSNNATQGNAGMLPVADAYLTQSNSVNDTKQKYNTGAEVDRNTAVSHNLNAGAALSWTVFDGFRMFAAYNRLQELEYAGIENARLTVSSTVAQIITGYFDVIRQTALLYVIDSTREISRIKLNIAKTRFEIGSSSKVEYLQAQVDLNADESAYKRQLLAIDRSRIQLNRLLARPATTEFIAADSIVVDISVLEKQLSEAEQDNSEIKIAQHNINISKYLVNEWRSQHFPELSLNAGYNYTRATSEANFLLENRSNGFNYGFTINYRLFDGFNLKRNIKNAKLEYDNSQIRFNEIKNAVNADLVIAQRELASNLEILRLEEANAELAGENMTLALERFRVGVSNELQLKEAQQSYTAALSRLVNIRYEAKVSETTFKRLSGMLLK
jgi:outer membrane protein